ncbi:questin oxidase family protein [Streptomyces huiliensis]|uniref:questin oxidase family protein n=1 Tax=Streptomyces huiliensis TaxID=2876027 RepID=UPI001CBBD2D5|nr:questin oxidase family protein [Streptomyces huiliensis]MBZ4320347.1 questin oxidase family protein [Streptomyces huiliensis]
MTDTTGTLDEALERLHANGPEFEGWLTNHAPMTVEALVRHGHAPRVHRWLDGYRHRLEDMPGRTGVRIDGADDASWRAALGDPSLLGDWIDHFTRALTERPWREVLVEWWPRLLPGITAGATHPVIRAGHAVRTLLDGETVDDGSAGDGSAPRVAELGHALGYWAARYQPLPMPVAASGTAGIGAALAGMPDVTDEPLGIRARFALLPETAGWPAAANALRPPAGPDEVPGMLAELVRETVLRYGERAHGSPVMLVHSATAPNAVLRTLPALPRELWVPSFHAAWEAAASVTAAYPAPGPLKPAAGAPATADEAFARAAEHGDAHAIKFTDTAVDVATADPEAAAGALAATVRAFELISPEDA